MCTENRPQQLFLPKRSPLKRQQARGAALAGTEPQREETSARCQFEWCWIWWRETPPHTLVPAPTEPGSGPSTVPWVGAARGGRQRLCSRPRCGGGSQLGTGRLVLSKRPLFSAYGFGKTQWESWAEARDLPLLFVAGISAASGTPTPVLSSPISFHTAAA